MEKDIAAKKKLSVLAFWLAPLCCVFLSLCIGRYPLPLPDVFRVLWSSGVAWGIYEQKLVVESGDWEPSIQILGGKSAGPKA